MVQQSKGASLRIAVIGEFDPASTSHRATNEALNHAAAHLSVPLEYSWLPSTTLSEDKFAHALNQFDGLWAAPGGPYRSMDGMLSAIRWAREQDWPYFAT
jgi:CTP synthase (UTP-ammonia lyase)